MDTYDMDKIQNAGFTLYRVLEDHKRITIRSEKGSWIKYEGFETKKATKERGMELRKQPDWVAV